MQNIILASASPRRKELLRQIGLTFEVWPAMGEEVMDTHVPREAVMRLSRGKMEEVLKRCDREEVLVLGADTVVALEGAVMGKPADERQARDMLQRIQGNTHQVYTGVALGMYRKGEKITSVFCQVTDVSVYPMDPREIDDYLALGEYKDKAGAYGIQGAFAAHIREIRGDYFNVVGLPVGRVWQEIKKMRKI